ncbi:MAG TPA: hypothetical protein V6D02_09165 [Candidatus Obscuribacterales bacterium]
MISKLLIFHQWFLLATLWVGIGGILADVTLAKPLQKDSPTPTILNSFQAAPSHSLEPPLAVQTPQVSPLNSAETIAVSPPDRDFVVEAAALSDLLPTVNGDNPPLVLEAPAAPAVVSQTAENADAIPWRFVVEPYLYLPLNTTGDVEARNVEVPFDYSLGDILESLTFAFYGRFEAWKGPWGMVFDGYYFNTVESDSQNIPTAILPPGLLPPQLTQLPVEGSVETAFLKLDFAGAYRFGDGNLPNALSTAETEFDLGPFVFDAIAGLRLYSFSNEIELSSLGFQRDFSRSDTFVEPLIGGRARWNFSDHLAAIAALNLSGFGIGTDISLESQVGIDWLASGNTSLTAGYRFTYIDYTQGSAGFNLFQHGPTLGVKFRF